MKRYEDETNLRCHILIDTSSSMFYPEQGLSKVDFSMYAAACLMALMRRQRDAFGLTLVSEKIDFESANKSTLAHQQLLFGRMEAVMNGEAKGKGTKMIDAIHQLSETLHRRSMVVIFSDLLENHDREADWWDALQHLKYQKHEVMLFHVADDATEMQFDFAGRPHEFIDRETGEKIRIDPREVKNIYIKKMQNYRQDFMAACLRYGIDWNEAYIRGDFNQVLMPFMVKRAGMV